MKRIRICFVMALLCLLLGSMVPVSAATPLDTQRECRLTVQYAGEGQGLTGLTVSVYRVAEALSDGTYQKIAPFAEYPVSVYDINTATGWKQAADTLLGYVAADNLVPTATTTTDEGGKAMFGGLPTGLYLVGDVTAKTATARWEFDGFLTYLPAVEEDVYVYDLAANPKGSRFDPEPTETAYKLLKVWADAGNEQKRPSSVTVDITKDGNPWKTVTLSEENRWSYAWADAEGATFHVVERDVPAGYAVTVSDKTTAFVLTNTWVEPDQPDEPNEPDGPDTPDEPDTPDDPDVPQTGDTEPLWLYVLLLVFSGVGLVMLGLGSMRGKRYGKTK